MQLGTVVGLLAASLAPPSWAQVDDVDYDIVYVRQPRYGDDQSTIWPEVFHPARAEPGADLVLLHPDGSEEVLVEGGIGSVTDPYVSFDGKSILYSYFYDLRAESLNSQRDDLPFSGADVFSIDLDSRQIRQLTFGEFTPNTGAGTWDPSNPLDPPAEFNRLGYGILNLGACPVPGGKIAFTSNRNGFTPPKGFTAPTMQLFVMDEDGANVTPIAPMTISSALHPTILRDGRLIFSSHEDQGLRDRRLWGIWSIWPDGRNWQPVVSAFRSPQAFHFMTQISGDDLVVVDYYNLNNNGFGSLYRMPVSPPVGVPPFGTAFPSENPEILQTVEAGFLYPFRMAFTPYGMHSISPMTHGNDEAAPFEDGGSERVGKFTHPSAAPDGDLLVVWSPGPCNDLNRPTPLPAYDGGIYVVPDSGEVWHPSDLVTIKNDPEFNEAWPRAVVPYADIHGVEAPDELPWLPNDGSLDPRLPAGTPFGLIGSSSLYKRESSPGWVTPWADDFDGLDAFNTSENGQSSNWSWQGSDAGRYGDDEIWAVRIVALEPNTHRSYGPNYGLHFDSHAGERMRILGEIPVRKTDSNDDPIIDSEGNPDTSFLAKIPADVPFTFQTIDRRGLALNVSQTWHQVRPGEVRTDCGGCHAHSQLPLDFSTTAAADPDHQVFDLAATTPLVRSGSTPEEPLLEVLGGAAFDVEFYRDIRPILERSCVSCHTTADPDPPGNLVLDDHSLSNGLPGDYRRLADDRDATWGHPPVIPNGVWRQTNASRYVRKFQSRRSLLIWKIFGERLDGWDNSDHPTEAIPGDADTLPPGATPNQADLDFSGSIMPPVDSGVEPLTDDEKMLIARWVDLGCPINSGDESGNGEFGWFLDDLRPTLTVSSPRPGVNPTALGEIVFGAVDNLSGLDATTLTVRTDFVAAGRPAGSELADLAVEISAGVYSIDLHAAISVASPATVDISIADLQGNVTRVVRTFSTALGPAIFADGFETGDLQHWSVN